jgi:hypothetical protein
LKCRGGRGAKSPHNIFKQLLACNNVWDLESVRDNTSGDLDEKTLEYFYTKIHDNAQFPAARCNMGDDIFWLYDHEASSGVESMNNANKAVRNHSAVDPVNSVILLVNLEAGRYKRERDAAWKWDTSLTPKGEEICHRAFEHMVCNNYTLAVTETATHHVTEVVKREIDPGGGRYYVVKTLKVAVHGSMFGSCTCGIPQTKTIPCCHMVAVVQSGKIPTLTQLTSMPSWCMTATWRDQYPIGTCMEGVADINRLKADAEPSRAIRCCPKIAAPNKPGAKKKSNAGRKNEGKRKKGPLEKKSKPRKKRIGTPMEDPFGVPMNPTENKVVEGSV